PLVGTLCVQREDRHVPQTTQCRAPPVLSSLARGGRGRVNRARRCLLGSAPLASRTRARARARDRTACASKTPPGACIDDAQLPALAASGPGRELPGRVTISVRA